MPSDRDAMPPEGWRKCEHLPQFLVCPTCSAICDSEGPELHIEWHEEQRRGYSGAARQAVAQ